MHSARRLVFAALFLMTLVLGTSAAEFRFDDEEPEVTDRVARISFIKGDVQIRRSDGDQWEKAVLNLPVVEGDEISTGGDARLEIQFNAVTHLRITENSYLKIVSLKDNAVAVSLPQGTASLTVTKFDADKDSFEIDAPKTTVAIQKTGRYRIDAGKSGDQEVRVVVGQNGEARVYSVNSGFTLRDGRSARVYVEGTLAGEYETGYAARFADEFDEWTAERDAVNADRLKRANYGQYYDDDVYGAEDLNDYGSWVHTRDYGYVWKPYRNSTAGYTDWSPYRYGHWRWLPVYGWTWVNDEPWGWATYHHGRWVWYNSGWYWSPYSYHRHRRSWWFPALVVLRVIDRRACWYPLPYHYAYYDYNWHYHSGRPRRPRHNQPAVPTPRPTPPPYGIIVQNPDEPIDRKGTVPATGIITAPIDDFGKRKGGYAKVSDDDARAIIIRKDPSSADELPRLPVMRDIGAKVSDDIKAATPRKMPDDVSAKIGAARRIPGEPLDNDLRNKIVLGNRPAVQPRANDDAVKNPSEGKSVPPTGAVGRPVRKEDDSTGDEPKRVIVPMPRNTTPQKQEEPRPAEQPPAKEPRSEPPRQAIPRSEPPSRNDPPQKSEPRSEPPRRSDPPPQKSEPKPDPPKQRDPPPQKSEPSKPAEEPKRAS